jgi:hypothetical protein
MITQEERETFIAALMIADQPMSLAEIAEATGLSMVQAKDCALWLKARGQLLAEHGADPAHSLVWKLRPQVLTFTQGMRALSKTLNYQRSKRIARGTKPPETKR